METKKHAILHSVSSLQEAIGVMRDTKLLQTFSIEKEKKEKEKHLFKNLRKEVEIGANGTQEYIIKKGINKGKIANGRTNNNN